MKWEYVNNFCSSNLYDKVIVTYEAESEGSPLEVTETGHSRHKKGTDIIDHYWIYKGYLINMSDALMPDGKGSRKWTDTFCVRSAPTEEPGTYMDRHFLTLEGAVAFIDGKIPEIISVQSGKEKEIEREIEEHLGKSAEEEKEKGL